MLSIFLARRLYYVDPQLLLNWADSMPRLKHDKETSATPRYYAKATFAEYALKPLMSSHSPPRSYQTEAWYFVGSKTLLDLATLLEK